jgi:hypothetical protein
VVVLVSLVVLVMVVVPLQRPAGVVVRVAIARAVVLVLLVVMDRSARRRVVAHSQSLPYRDVQRSSAADNDIRG